MKKLVLSICFCTAVFVFSTVEAFGCSCVPSPPVEEVFEQHTAIFSGKVISDVKSGNVRKIKVRVGKSWKGKSPKIITLTTSAVGSMCGYSFVKGASYLIYADGSKWNKLSVTICSRTKLLAQAKDDIEALNELPPEVKSAPK